MVWYQPGPAAGPPRAFRLPGCSFEDGAALLRVAEERRLEGVVSQRRDKPYRFGRLQGLGEGEDDDVA